MPERTRSAALLELSLLLLVVSCQHPARKHEARPVSLKPRPASSFECDSQACVQQHPRLPDTGAWRCAELERVVWCAGGEPAAGVVHGPTDPAFHCGPRWGGGDVAEQVCVDQHPDYPTQQDVQYRCRFVQERGIARRCERASAAVAAPRGERGVPACWLGRDCRSGHCDRGSCSCQSDGDCEVGRCEQGLCSEVKR